MMQVRQQTLIWCHFFVDNNFYCGLAKIIMTESGGSQWRPGYREPVSVRRTMSRVSGHKICFNAPVSRWSSRLKNGFIRNVSEPKKKILKSNSLISLGRRTWNTNQALHSYYLSHFDCLMFKLWPPVLFETERLTENCTRVVLFIEHIGPYNGRIFLSQSLVKLLTNEEAWLRSVSGNEPSCTSIVLFILKVARILPSSSPINPKTVPKCSENVRF